ncbi:hypothetical protein MHU86_16754 [Fragilaria crotonensis]|nr:hypothetical protein MHU86_16754 [Fragilaria crotonensis]
MHLRRAASKTDTAGTVLGSQVQGNGGSKSKSRKHGFVSVWNGWLLILCVILVTAIVAYFNFEGECNSASAKRVLNRSPTTLVQSPSASRIGHIPIEIPDCESSPWKPDEDLVGICPGRKALDLSIQSAIECSKACCADPNCIVWQFRADRGCLHGGDVRIGQEKDGPAAYCSDHPPLRWQGQMLKGRKDIECTKDAWHPDEQPGQCFGLGDVRPGIETAQECKAACCSIDICAAWQFQETLGCFYNVRMHSCQKGDDPVFFEPFVGRRKKLSSRTYKGRNGKASVSWKQKGNPTS